MTIRFKTFTLIILSLSGSVMAQVPEKPITAEEEQKVWASDTVANKMADTMVNENLNLLVSDKLDSLVNTWYIKNAFVYDNSEFETLPEEIKTYLPDSVYISRLQALDSFLPLPYNETVRNLIGLYTIRKRELTSYIYGLSNYYFPIFEEALERYNLPHELKYLPIIESALNPKAFSRAGASGLWQFMIGTGKLYGLEINSYIDERNDPIKATDAAARYLRDLYAIYGDWHIVIAAYNCGPGNINKAVRRSGGKQSYWDIYYSLPRETRGYIPVFIAATYMMHYGKEHLLKAAEPKFKTVTDTIEIHNYLNFEQIAATINIPVEELRQLNPQYRRDIIPARPEKPYLLKLPAESVSAFIDNEVQIFAFNRDKYFPNNMLVPLRGSRTTASKKASSGTSPEGMKEITYVVKSGDNLGSIASKHRVTVNDLREWNDFRKKTLQIGQRITVYVPGKSVKTKVAQVEKPKTDQQTVAAQSPETTTISADSATALSNATNPAAAGSDEYIIYTVQHGDSLFTIAKKFPGITDADLKVFNNIRNVKGLYPGQQLKIPKRA
ncbi:MAG TPA: LysM peptidoglycan-binding domain-containing protein [Prolixibacteraceae bacterium]|nr:LysM peptidoglycan-binding domain-containing protein [Prolixibacteraceae bacterium]